MKIERTRSSSCRAARAGITLGSPLAFTIRNKDHVIEQLPVPPTRAPGTRTWPAARSSTHADPRAVLERASARETAARVALGALARQLLDGFGIEVFAHVARVGGESVAADAFERAGERRLALRDATDFHMPRPRVRRALARGRRRARAERRLARRRVRGARARPAAGAGRLRESERAADGAPRAAPVLDPGDEGGRVRPRLRGRAPRPARWCRTRSCRRAAKRRAGAASRRETNRAGGLEGGMTTGEELVVRVAMKPIPSLRRGLPTRRLRRAARRWSRPTSART